MILKKKYALLGILFFIFCGNSRVFADDILTLDQSIKIALDRSLSILSAKEEIKARESKERSAKADFYPKLSTSYSYTRLDDDTVNAAKHTAYPWDPISETHYQWVTPTYNRNTYELNLTLTQPLFTGWKITTAHELASLGVDTARIQKDIVIQNLILSVKEAYFGILKAQKLENVARQALEQLKEHLRLSQAFYDEGIIPKNDLLETEVKMAQARQDLIKATNVVEIAKSRFNNLLRREINQEVLIKDILDYHPEKFSLNGCFKRARENRLEINAASLVVAAAEKQVKLSKSDYYPTVSLLGNYQRQSFDVFLQSEEGKDVDKGTIMLMGEWTFWEWGKKRYDVSAARAQVAKAKNILNEIKDNIRLEVKNSYLYLRDVEKYIHVTRTAIVQAEENFRMNEERYKQQVATSTNLLDAQTLLTQAKSSYFNSLSEYNIAKARLERTMGVGTGEKR